MQKAPWFMSRAQYSGQPYGNHSLISEMHMQHFAGDHQTLPGLWDSLMMEAVRTSETSVDNHFTRQYIPEDSSEHLLV
jgi:hypothetical protein